MHHTSAVLHPLEVDIIHTHTHWQCCHCNRDQTTSSALRSHCRSCCASSSASSSLIACEVPSNHAATYLPVTLAIMLLHTCRSPYVTIFTLLTDSACWPDDKYPSFCFMLCWLLAAICMSPNPPLTPNQTACHLTLPLPLTRLHVT